MKTMTNKLTKLNLQRIEKWLSIMLLILMQVDSSQGKATVIEVFLAVERPTEPRLFE